MAARTVNNLPPAGAHDDAVPCLLAIELSKKTQQVCRLIVGRVARKLTASMSSDCSDH
jgi:hypothetical protein